MKRRDFTKVVPAAALVVAATPAAAASADPCDGKTQMTFTQFEDKCWDIVVFTAAQNGATFGSEYACREAYKSQKAEDGEKWHDKFKRNWEQDVSNGLDPCTDDKFTQRYLVCAARAGKVAAGISTTGVITVGQFEAAMLAVKKTMTRLQARGTVNERDLLCG